MKQEDNTEGTLDGRDSVETTRKKFVKRKPMSEKTKEKIRLSLLKDWQENPRKLSDKTKEKISNALKGRMPKNIAMLKPIFPRTDAWRKKVGAGVKKAWQEKDWTKRNKKVSLALKGRKITWAINPDKKGCFKKGNKPWNMGTRDPNYKGVERKLRLEILKRDMFSCQLCKIFHKKKKPLHIHHIDWNHLNNHHDNLISLCQRCHAKQQGNKKEWIKYWQKRANLRYSPNCIEIYRGKQK